MSEINVNEAYNDEEIAAKEKAEKSAAIEADMKKPYDPEAILEVRHLRKCFPIEKNLLGKVQKELVAVDDVSFTLKAGETLGIVGESGCGKTTMGRTILKLHESSGGQIIFNGEDVAYRRSRRKRGIGVLEDYLHIGAKMSHLSIVVVCDILTIKDDLASAGLV